MTTGSWAIGHLMDMDFYAGKAWNGTDLPAGWRRANPGKPLPIHPYTTNMLKQTQTKSRCVWPADGYYMGDAYVYTCSDTVPARASANLSLTALNKITSEMRGHDFNAAVFAAEAAQSVATVKNTSLAVLRALYGTVTGNWREVVQGIAALPGQRSIWAKKLKSGDISGAWLSLKYGWEPLIGDCFEAVKAIERLQSEPRTLKYRAQSSERFVKPWSPSFSNGVLEITDDVTVRFIVEVKEQLSAARSLGVLSPYQILWEKLPWSFVVDWFVPIGTYLDTLSVVSGQTITSFTRTEYSVRNIKVKQPATSTTRAYPYAKPIGGSYAARSVRVERTTGTTVILPRPGLRAWAKAFSTGHMQNAAALIEQQVTRIRRGRT